MASDNEACCESDPNFAVICGFLEKFGVTCGLTNIDFLDLQDMLENNQEVPQELIDLHVKLLRKARKSVSSERWERAIIKLCHGFCSQDAWEIERFGYKKARLSSKLRILKELLEMQFDYNVKFKNEINKLTAEELRTQPLGRDRLGHVYWFQSDNSCQIRVYKEDPDEETWNLIVKDREGLVNLITQLSDGKEAVVNEDSNSLESEKPVIDTGQRDSSLSKSDQVILIKNTEVPGEPTKIEENNYENSHLDIGSNGSQATVEVTQPSKLRNKKTFINEDLEKSNEVNDGVTVSYVESKAEAVLEKEDASKLGATLQLKSGISIRIKPISELISPGGLETNKKSEITGVKEKYIRSDLSAVSLTHHRKAVDSAGFDVRTNYLKRPLEEEEDIEDFSYVKQPRLDRPTLLGNKKKKSYSDEEEAEPEEEEQDEKVSSAVEEPLMLVTGEGLGHDNRACIGSTLEKSGNSPIVGEEIEESVMYVFGAGNGQECETGNENDNLDKSQNRDSTSETMHKKSNTNSSDGASTSIEINDTVKPIQKPEFKLGTIIDVRTNKFIATCTNVDKKSRWDVGKPKNDDSEESIMENENSKVYSDNNTEYKLSVENLEKCYVKEPQEPGNLLEEENQKLEFGVSDCKSTHIPSQKSLFFFGPGCLQMKPMVSSAKNYKPTENKDTAIITNVLQSGGNTSCCEANEDEIKKITLQSNINDKAKQDNVEEEKKNTKEINNSIHDVSSSCSAIVKSRESKSNHMPKENIDVSNNNNSVFITNQICASNINKYDELNANNALTTKMKEVNPILDDMKQCKLNAGLVSEAKNLKVADKEHADLSESNTNVKMSKIENCNFITSSITNEPISEKLINTESAVMESEEPQCLSTVKSKSKGHLFKNIVGNSHVSVSEDEPKNLVDIKYIPEDGDILLKTDVVDVSDVTKDVNFAVKTNDVKNYEVSSQMHVEQKNMHFTKIDRCTSSILNKFYVETRQNATNPERFSKDGLDIAGNTLQMLKDDFGNNEIRTSTNKPHTTEVDLKLKFNSKLSEAKILNEESSNNVGVVDCQMSNIEKNEKQIDFNCKIKSLQKADDVKENIGTIAKVELDQISTSEITKKDISHQLFENRHKQCTAISVQKGVVDNVTGFSINVQKANDTLLASTKQLKTGSGVHKKEDEKQEPVTTNVRQKKSLDSIVSSIKSLIHKKDQQKLGTPSTLTEKNSTNVNVHFNEEKVSSEANALSPKSAVSNLPHFENVLLSKNHEKNDYAENLRIIPAPITSTVVESKNKSIVESTKTTNTVKESTSASAIGKSIDSTSNNVVDESIKLKEPEEPDAISTQLNYVLSNTTKITSVECEKSVAVLETSVQNTSTKSIMTDKSNVLYLSTSTIKSADFEEVGIKEQVIVSSELNTNLNVTYKTTTTTTSEPSVNKECNSNTDLHTENNLSNVHDSKIEDESSIPEHATKTFPMKTGINITEVMVNATAVLPQNLNRPGTDGSVISLTEMLSTSEKVPFSVEKSDFLLPNKVVQEPGEPKLRFEDSNSASKVEENKEVKLKTNKCLVEGLDLSKNCGIEQELAAVSPSVDITLMSNHCSFPVEKDLSVEVDKKNKTNKHVPALEEIIAPEKIILEDEKTAAAIANNFSKKTFEAESGASITTATFIDESKLLETSFNDTKNEPIVIPTSIKVATESSETLKSVISRSTNAIPIVKLSQMLSIPDAIAKAAKEEQILNKSESITSAKLNTNRSSSMKISAKKSLDNTVVTRQTRSSIANKSIRDKICKSSNKGKKISASEKSNNSEGSSLSKNLTKYDELKMLGQPEVRLVKLPEIATKICTTQSSSELVKNKIESHESTKTPFRNTRKSFSDRRYCQSGEKKPTSNTENSDVCNTTEFVRISTRITRQTVSEKAENAKVLNSEDKSSEVLQISTKADLDSSKKKSKKALAEQEESEGLEETGSYKSETIQGIPVCMSTRKNRKSLNEKDQTQKFENENVKIEVLSFKASVSKSKSVNFNETSEDTQVTPNKISTRNMKKKITKKNLKKEQFDNIKLGTASSRPNKTELESAKTTLRKMRKLSSGCELEKTTNEQQNKIVTASKKMESRTLEKCSEECQQNENSNSDHLHMVEGGTSKIFTIKTRKSSHETECSENIEDIDSKQLQKAAAEPSNRLSKKMRKSLKDEIFYNIVSESNEPKVDLIKMTTRKTRRSLNDKEHADSFESSSLSSTGSTDEKQDQKMLKSKCLLKNKSDSTENIGTDVKNLANDELKQLQELRDESRNIMKHKPGSRPKFKAVNRNSQDGEVENVTKDKIKEDELINAEDLKQVISGNVKDLEEQIVRTARPSKKMRLAESAEITTADKIKGFITTENVTTTTEPVRKVAHRDDSNNEKEPPRTRRSLRYSQMGGNNMPNENNSDVDCFGSDNQKIEDSVNISKNSCDDKLLPVHEPRCVQKKVPLLTSVEINKSQTSSNNNGSDNSKSEDSNFDDIISSEDKPDTRGRSENKYIDGNFEETNDHNSIKAVNSPESVSSGDPDIALYSSDDVTEVLPSDPLAVSEDDFNTIVEEHTKPVTLSSLTFDHEESVASPSIRITRKRVAQQSIDALRQIRLPDKKKQIEKNETDDSKKMKLKKRSIDRNLRRSIEEEKLKTVSSSEEEGGEKVSRKNFSKEKDGKNVKNIAKRRMSAHSVRTTDSPVLSSDAPSETSRTDVSNTPPVIKQKKPRKQKRTLLGLEISEETENIMKEGPPVGVRQSRRIAQLKIKEEAERRKLEELTLNELKEEQRKRKTKKNEDKDYKIEKKKRSKHIATEDDTTGDAESDEKKKRKRKRKHWNPTKQFDVFKAWKSSSESSSSEDEDEEEDIEDDDDSQLVFKSDHEFSPESDLEEDGEVQPLKRARTARKESDAEEVDDCACQKCGQKDHPEWILLCDNCDCGWHCSCLRPALLVIPEGDWFCPPCQHATLVKNLEACLIEYDKKISKREMETRRKERLAYVGISLDNVLPSKEPDEHRLKHRHYLAKETGRIRDYEEDDDDDHETEESGSEESDSTETTTSSESDSEEPVYQLRERRQAHSYRFNDYDDLINSAIQDDLDAVKGAGNQGRGKDISTIVNAEKEEIQTECMKNEIATTEALFSANDGSALRNSTVVVDQTASEAKGSKPLPPVVPPNYDLKPAEDEFNEEEIRPIKKNLTKKKHRKLNSLDVSSGDDAESDEDFKGSSTSESEEDFEDEDDLSGSETSDDDTRRGKRRKDFGPVRRSTRARISRYDRDFINDSDSEDEEAPRRKKTKSFWDETESEESDRSWGRRKRKAAKSKKKTSTNKTKKSKKKKKKKRTGEDSDPEVYKKKPNIKFGGLNDEEEVGRRTRGKKINYLEALGTDSEEEMRRKPSRIEESEEEYNLHDDEDFQHQLENDKDSDESGVENVLADIGTIPKPKVRGRGKSGLKIPRKPKDAVPPSMEFPLMLTDLSQPPIVPTEQAELPMPQQLTAQMEISPSLLEPAVPAILSEQELQDIEDEPNPIEQINKNVEEMNEQEMEKMMEEEDYANKQLQLVALQIEKEKKRKEREAKRLEKLIEKEQKVPKKRGRKPKNQSVTSNTDLAIPFGESTAVLMNNAMSNNAELSEPPGVNLPMFSEIAPALNADGTPKKRRGRGKESPLHGSKLGIAAPPQPFSQSQPTPSVITRMLQSQSSQGNFSRGTSKYFPGAPLTVDSQLALPTVSASYHPGSSGPRGPITSPYQQPAGMSNFTVVRNSPAALHGLHSPGPTGLPPLYHTHRSLDPSPSGGGPVNVSASNQECESPSLVPPAPSSPLSKGDPTPPPPPYTRPQVGHFPPNTINTPAGPRHISIVPPHLQQHRTSNMSPYHPGVPPNYHYGSYPPPPLNVDEGQPPPVYSSPAYSDSYSTEAGIPVPSTEGNDAKAFDEDSGGEFVGLVSYFSSQREDDLDT